MGVSVLFILSLAGLFLCPLLLALYFRIKCKCSDPPPTDSSTLLLTIIVFLINYIMYVIGAVQEGACDVGFCICMFILGGLMYLMCWACGCDNKILQCPECKYKIRRKGKIISQEQQTYWDREERTMYNKYDEEIGHFYEDVQKVRTLSLVEYTCSHCNHKFRQWE